MAIYPVARLKPMTRTPRENFLVIRPSTTTTNPVYADYKNHFPVGVRMGADVDVYTPGSDQPTLNIHAKYNSGWRRYIQDPVIGLRENNMEYVDGSTFSLSLDTSQSEFVSGSDPILNKLDVDNRMGKKIRLIFGTMNDAGIKAVLENPAATYNDAVVAVQQFFATYDIENRRSIMTWAIGDDITTGNKGAQAQHIAHALQDLDPWGRPALYVCTDDNLWTVDTDLRVAFSYGYPTGVRPDGDVAPEGDFHRTSFQGSYGTNADYSDMLRAKIKKLPKEVPLWFHLQTHGNAPFGGTGVPVNSIRKPTAKELRKMFWVAIAEGVKGLFWFTYDLVPGLTEGLAHITENVDRRHVAAELGGRLTEEIRQILLKCDILTDINRNVVHKFVATGGGSTGYDVNYPNAHITTLQHRETGKYYTVVVNNSLNPAAIQITSPDLVGQLTNLETGEVMPLGGSYILNGLDGTIFSHNDMMYDRIVPIDFTATDGGEARWKKHWANPESTWHIPYGQIPLIENTVVVTPTTIVNLVENCTEPTTFLLSPGLYDYGQTPLLWKRQSDMHFAPLDPNNRPIVRSISGWGVPDIADYHAWAGALRANNTPAHLDVWNDQPRNIIIRDLDFRGVPEPPCERIQVGPVLGEWYPRIGGCNFKMYQDILIEGCTFDEFVAPHRNQIDDYTGTCTYDEAPQGGHPATIYNSSNANFCVVRNCHFNGWVNPQNGVGGPTPFTCDGTYGFVFVDNSTSGRFLSGSVFLTNDDHSFDQDHTGTIEKWNERHSQFCVVANNDFTQSVGGMSFDIRGGDMFFYKNVFTNGSNVTEVWHIDSQNDPYQSTRFKHVYHFYNLNIKRNIYKASPIQWVESSVPVGDLTNVFRGRIGKWNIQENAVYGFASGSNLSWIKEDNVAGDGPHIIKNNFPPLYSGEAWEDLGVISQANAVSTALGKRIVGIQEHAERMYFSYGDWSGDQPSSISILAHRPHTNDIVALGATMTAHAGHAMRALDNELWILGVDTPNTFLTYTRVFDDHSATIAGLSARPTSFSFDAVKFNSDVYIAGSKFIDATTNHAVVWRATGATGTALEITGGTPDRIYGLFVLGNTLYAAPNSGALRTTTDGSNWVISPRTLTPIVWKPIVNPAGTEVAYMDVDTSAGATGSLRKFNGTTQTTLISSGVQDICIDPTGLICALVGTQLMRSNGAWTTLAPMTGVTLPANATSIFTSVYGIYVGTSDSHLWRLHN